jgi:hypothetical protein
MTVKELIEILECLDGDAEVTIMSQPNYPLEHRIDNVVTSHDIGDGDQPIEVYIVEGSQVGYGKRKAWDHI